MRFKGLAVAAPIIVACFGSPLYGAEVSGVIVSVDAAARTVTLDNGQSFVLKDTVDRLTLRIGERVRIQHEPTPDGLNVAQEVVPQG